VYGRGVAIPSEEKQGVLDRLVGGESVAEMGREWGVSAAYLYRLRLAERKRVGWKPDVSLQALSDVYCQASQCKNRVSNGRVARGSVTCSDVCHKRLKSQGRSKHRAKKRTEQAAHRRAVEASYGAPVAEEKKRRGSTYKRIVARGDWVELLLAGGMTHAYVAEQLGTSQAAVSRSVQALIEDAALAEAKADWRPSRFVEAMLPVAKLERIRELGPAGEGSDEFRCLVTELTRAYSVFSRRFFRLEGNRPFIEPFHMEWIAAILTAYAVGAKQAILSPPRHGKSELLIRFTVWLIAMFPNIRIIWVAANSDVAQIMLGAVKDHLENNEELIAAVLPPGDGFRPPRDSGKKWTGKEIKIRQQTHIGAKSSSMLALGRTSKILSRDADLLFVDDLEDFDTTREASQREYSRNKFAEIGTRKEERTAWINIGSRQHPDDIPHQLMKMAGTEQAWRIIENTAHAECQLDSDVIEGHDENGCVLFPKVRSYRWLMEKKAEMDALGIPGAYEMRYLNMPVPTSGIVFKIDVIREMALDRSRGVGVESIGQGRRIGGIDPASRGTQAAFAWQYSPGALSMIDLETEDAGGFAGAHRIIRDWYTRYGIEEWRYEDNSQQIEFFKDPRTVALQRELGIRIRPVSTQSGNKHDPELGISATAPLYHDGTISLPYGTSEARRKVNMLLRQLELWTTDGIPRGKGKKTDVKMASWFPFPDILRWMREERQISLQMGAESSYPGFATMNDIGWTTNYPGGS